MYRPVRRVWNAIVRLDEIRTIILWLFPSLAGVWAMISAYMANLAWHQILFWGSGVFAFVILGTARLFEVIQSATVFEKTALTESSVVNVSDQGGKLILRMQFKFHNFAEVSLYIHVKRADLSVDGHVTPDARLRTNVVVVHPHSDYTITAASVPNIDRKPILRGRLNMTIDYGRKRDYLAYRLEYEGEPIIHLAFDEKDPRTAHVACTTSHLKTEHTINPTA